jgi:hypothetical protein
MIVTAGATQAAPTRTIDPIMRSLPPGAIVDDRAVGALVMGFHCHFGTPLFRVNWEKLRSVEVGRDF